MTAFMSIRARKQSHINKYHHRLHVCEVFCCSYSSSHHKAQSATQTEDGMSVLRTDSRDGVHSEKFSLSRAFGNCFSLSLNACFVLFWNCVLVLVSLSNGTH